MRVRWLGWAGVEIEAAGATLVIDPLADPAAVWSPFGERACAVPMPSLATSSRPGRALAGLVTHLHRDHADAAALAAALAPDAVVLRPEAGAGDQVADGALRQAEIELARAKLALRECPPWESVQVGPFRVTALPAVDGLGDPQLSWLVAAEEQSVLHCGDTIFHGFWWRVALAYGPIDVAFLPINGSLVGFPHRTPASPYPVVMTPEQAATAGRLLGARNVVPMHYGAYSFPGVYEPVADAPSRFVAAAAGEDYTTRLLDVGEWYELAT